MADFYFSEKAEQDLEEITDYTHQQWGSLQVIKYLDGLTELCQTLADSPVLGMKRDNLAEGLLSFSYESHILYYLAQPHGITVVRVLHKRRDPVKHL
ncbi:type II toxin-antitoxin system RelE/ParE family toxin [Spartinivicinus poritis]|uniref:Toxin n=1 Tax=Spartinivicinus poritis TaxID=2994640 RepID=A0ABT5UHE7_9GAMM|nr:type II toxin-antitoxin system RelE/ParE family toxin [Spartinivicinus sp. A2-2]MDE1465737.1 type II toxin-antitoxin system RelE/ParE family toxin [Spartinivicinus sp. A2-2]